MKRIIVPTDFSANATNALDYAFHLAKLTSAKVFILHVYHQPIFSPSIPSGIVENIIEEQGRDARYKMLKLVHRLNQKRYTHFEPIIRMGFLHDEVIELATQLEADLIVMGTKGASGLLDDFFGSNTAAVIEKRKFPVLAIPSNASYEPIQNIVLAADYRPISNLAVYKPMVELASALRTKINVLYIDEHSVFHSTDNSSSEHQLKDLVRNYSPSFHFSADRDVTRGINEFVKEENSGMLVMVSRKKSFLKQLFTKSHTRHMALHSSVPLLVLPEKETSEVYA